MSNKAHETFMRRAIELSKQGGLIEKTGGVFGAVVVKEGKIIGEGYNQVVKNHDPTCHAEIQAIRDACKKISFYHLDGCILYTTGEPCPMCLSAAYWAHVKEIYFASRVEDALKYGNFQDLDFYEEVKKPLEERLIPLKEILRDEMLSVWKTFSQMPGRLHY